MSDDKLVERFFADFSPPSDGRMSMHQIIAEAFEWYADEVQSERASMEGEIAKAREQLRLEMLEQPVTEGRDTYEDGFANGLAHAINRLDALTSSKTGDER